MTDKLYFNPDVNWKLRTQVEDSLLQDIFSLYTLEGVPLEYILLSSEDLGGVLISLEKFSADMKNFSEYLGCLLEPFKNNGKRREAKELEGMIKNPEKFDKHHVRRLFEEWGIESGFPKKNSLQAEYYVAYEKGKSSINSLIEAIGGSNLNLTPIEKVTRDNLDLIKGLSKEDLVKLKDYHTELSGVLSSKDPERLEILNKGIGKIDRSEISFSKELKDVIKVIDKEVNWAIQNPDSLYLRLNPNREILDYKLKKPLEKEVKGHKIEIQDIGEYLMYSSYSNILEALKIVRKEKRISFLKKIPYSRKSSRIYKGLKNLEKELTELSGKEPEVLEQLLGPEKSVHNSIKGFLRKYRKEAIWVAGGLVLAGAAIAVDYGLEQYSSSLQDKLLGLEQLKANLIELSENAKIGLDTKTRQVVNSLKPLDNGILRTYGYNPDLILEDTLVNSQIADPITYLKAKITSANNALGSFNNALGSLKDSIYYVGNKIANSESVLESYKGIKNRLIWTGVGISSLSLLYSLFTSNLNKIKQRSSGIKNALSGPEPKLGIAGSIEDEVINSSPEIPEHRKIVEGGWKEVIESKHYLPCNYEALKQGTTISDCYKEYEKNQIERGERKRRNKKVPESLQTFYNTVFNEDGRAIMTAREASEELGYSTSTAYRRAKSLRKALKVEIGEDNADLLRFSNKAKNYKTINTCLAK